MGVFNFETISKWLRKPFIFFPLATFIIFWPLSLGIYSFKNDILTYYYPVRILASDAINTCSLPLWSPYINMGYPLHGDLQSSAWNPIVWIFSIFTHYSLYGFHLEVLFYFCLAGIGFYFLCKEIGLGTLAALSLGLAYEVSGPLLDSVQFFTLFTSACYLPFILLFFRRNMISLKFKDAALTGIFLYLLLTGGYPSIFIGTFYLLTAYYIYFIFNGKLNFRRLYKYFIAAISISIVFLILSLPAILSFTEMIKHISRGKEQKLSFIFENSTTILSLFSFISPFSTTSEMPGLQTNILIRSVYIGIIPFVILIEGLFNKTIKYSSEIKFFLTASIIFLLFALGENFLIRELAYYTLPFMKYFRHPGTFRLFVTFLLLIVTASHLTLTNAEKRKYSGIKKITIAITLIIITALIITSNFDSKYSFRELAASISKMDLKDIPFFQKLLLQTPLIIITLALILYTCKHQSRFKMLLYILMIDVLFATQLNLPVTVIGAKKMDAIERYVKTPNEPYPIVKLKSITQNSLNSFDKTKTIGSSLIYKKQIGRNDYFITPGNLVSQNDFYKSDLRKIIFEFPVAYFADTIITEIPETYSDTGRKVVLLENMNVVTETSPLNGTVNDVKVDANMFTLDISTKGEGILVLQQNYYPGWHAYIDEKETPVFKANLTFMAILVTEGRHEIKFRYRPRLIYELWIVSTITLLALICFFIVAPLLANVYKRDPKRK